jgi:hypothetical protein
MTHLELENLTSDYLEGQLEPGMKKEVEAHLSTCPSCLEMVGEVRRAMELCHAAPELEPDPWLVRKIMLATVGERKPGLAERLAAFLRPMRQPRFAYAIAMAVFSFSIIVQAAGINLRRVTIGDLNPLTWPLKADRAVHLYAARAEKFWYDLRVVVELESRLRQLRAHPEEEQGAPKQEPPAGGSTNSAPLTVPTLATNQARVRGVTGPTATLLNGIVPNPLSLEPVRSQKP